MRWAEMSVECAPEAVEAVSYAFLQAGCGGVMQRGENPVLVQGSLPVSDLLTPQIQALRRHLDRLPEFGLPPIYGAMTLRYVEDEDWANAWKQHFKPFRLGRRLVVKPSWETYTPTDDELILELDPGMAFGTGGHPTTQLCLRALEDHVTLDMTVADIGTGSGILAIAAANLGAATVYATDIDSLPRKIARENVARNGLEAIVHILEMEDFDAQARDCDLIVANIVANTIIEIAPSVVPRLKPGGIFIACGIVEEHHDLVQDALRAVGLVAQETLREDIWGCLISRRS
ncbi:MAG TPA: 50S ribosomal protein L11 methyltransferase [Chthonomonadaceae bacterium]|nr:50S ribosomal protein L11 methyltransferase [Chthonomonadaceae bacterium]